MRWIQVLLGMTLALWAGSAAAQPASTNYKLLVDGMVAGGATTTSASYAMLRSSVGDVVGSTTSQAGHTLNAGLAPTEQLLYLVATSVPTQPSINPLSTPTSVAGATLTGTKTTDAVQIVLSSQEATLGAVIYPTSTTWQAPVTLTNGSNFISATAKDIYGNTSVPTSRSALLDTSPPSAPVVTDDGFSTASASSLHASWSASDAETGIAQCEYAIGTTAGATDVVNWTGTGASTEVTRAGLTLIQAQTYYWSVRAQNNAGGWSTAGEADGIIVNQNAPSITAMTPAANALVNEDVTVTLVATVNEPDGDALLYQYSVDGVVVQSWTSAPTYDWMGIDFGAHSYQIDVSDGLGGLVSDSSNLFAVKQPIAPPQ